MRYKSLQVHPTRVPIEYKKFHPKDFSIDYSVKENRIFEIETDSDGYIGNSILANISIEEKNTVVVNAGVGLGKSTACVKIARQYIEQKDSAGNNLYVVVFVAPFLSLINQYYKALIATGLPLSDVFNYLHLKSDNLKQAESAQVQLITINTLIGNYGDDSFYQSKQKRNYLSSLIKQCEKKRKKVVFIFDEIHDSVHNFRQEFIFNLWKWKRVIHKSFILSATFTESSKIVVKYLADLTDDKIQILESKRQKQQDGTSRLHIFLNNNFTYTADDEDIAGLIEQQIDIGKSVHILSYSEKLATDIVVPQKQKGQEPRFSLIGKILKERTNGMNLCTSTTQLAFDKTKCNVGTTFKTGVSIEGDNISLIIIFPQAASYQNKFEKYFGIFSDGTTAITQAVARVRKGQNNDIFIVTPAPKLLIKNAPNHLGSDNYLTRISKVPDFKILKTLNKFEEYTSLDSQYSILEKYIRKSSLIASKGIEYHNIQNVFIKNRSATKPKLNFLDLQEFILSNGDRFLASGYSIFGSSPSAFLIWAAYNNQFENCTLNSVLYGEIITLKEGKV